MPRSRLLLLAVGLAAGLFATFASPLIPPAHGQTGPRRATPVTGAPGLPLATPSDGLPTAPATVVVAPPPPAGGSASPLAPSALDDAGAIAPPSAAAAVPPGASAPTPVPQPAGAAPGEPRSAVPDPAATGAPPLPAGDALAPAPARSSDPFAAEAAVPLVAAIVPAAPATDRRGSAIVTSGPGAPVRVTVLVPPRDDGPSDVRVAAAALHDWSAISLPGVTISRAFTVDVRRPDGGLIELHPRALTLAVGVEDADVVAAGGDPRRLRILRWDPTRSVAVVLATVFDPRARTLSAATDHTSLFLIAAAPTEIGEIAALLKAPWGDQPVPAGPLPVRMPRVGSSVVPFAVPSALAGAGVLSIVLCAWWPRRSLP